MKAIVQERFGPPEVLELIDADVPHVGPGEVLIRVRAAALNPADWHVLRGDPLVARLGGIGLRRPRGRIAGSDVAGRVVGVGAGVTGLREGDEVHGSGRGAFAEYAAAPAALLAPVPPGLSAEQAAAMPTAGITALHAIRDVGAVTPGTRVLVNGASGGVGTFAVQIAVALGAEVTGVCSTRNLDLVRSLGAAAVVDHTADDVTGRPERYDVVVDLAGNHPIPALRRVLVPDGTLVLCAGGAPGAFLGAVGTVLRAAVTDPFVRHRIRFLASTPKPADLPALGALVADGLLRPVIDRTYPLVDVAEGLRYVEQGHARGKVVVTVS
ncbi:NAD(P)-dependent alcohol dehydrogenase [Pseudonocardia abyssalis]|uniref:NAD(P)-dependent alcohol dehydrogenase n=1 Tax=Pseudonocardia abyssalis TaxID=2792008 RepID=A0ABS6UXP6_9PSEU|nr:NAD(P)-dependent alcohol dehydrogenase [Pseudonocardia abyssalis]MBW0114858.1 NAD(P)-dependent alcohol dehydrogenase [Pseudonocardia abyssalis]MBW0137048.1 NAD(P)-dependent alcohol dehydrogenase [Pseudonocardia abyssalis]